MSMLFATAQCDLFRLGEAERGVILWFTMEIV